jgi:hypothetical protein
MNLEELKSRIDKNRIPAEWYSLDDGLKTDAFILYKNYSLWEFFYLDERGGRNGKRIFKTDEEAYDYLWHKLETELSYRKTPPKI